VTYDHVTIYWLPSSGAITQCGRKAHAIKAGRTSRVQQGDLPANPDEAYMAWLRRVMPSEREEAAIVEYARRLESGEEVQQELVVREE